MKKIKVTFIDTASHGYYSVGKADFLLVGGNAKDISSCSGHTLTRLYLEEDCDAALFFDKAKEKGFEVEIKNSYNPKFSIHHGYNPDLFAYTPEVGDILNKGLYKICELKMKMIFIRHSLTGMVYRISLANPFLYIENVVKLESLVR